MKKDLIKKILSVDLNPVEEANVLMKALLAHISKVKKTDKASALKIYDYSQDKIQKFDQEDSKYIDLSIKVAYFNEWSKKINLDPEWVISIENKFKTVLNRPKISIFFEFFLENFNAEKDKIANQLTQIFVQIIKRCYIEGKKNGLESSWFYLEFGRVLSDFFIKESFCVDNIKLKKMIEFFHVKKISTVNFKAFCDESLDFVDFFNKNFSRNLDIRFSNIIEHFMICNYLKSAKDYELFFNKLNLQYVEYSSEFINGILQEDFDQQNIRENNKTYKIFKPKGSNVPTIYNVNKSLPSVSLDFDIEKKQEKYFVGDQHAFDVFFHSSVDFLHSNTNLNSSLTSEYLDILKKLRNFNSFKINAEMLMYLIEIFKEKKKSIF